jgi:hypothetical protein
MRTTTRQVYLDLAAKLTGRCAAGRRWGSGRHTRLERVDDHTVGVRLHETLVATVTEGGKLTVDTGGWRTVTTKERINEILHRVGLGVYARKGEWFWNDFRGTGEVEVGAAFTEGDYVDARGRLHTQAKPKDLKAHATLRKRILAYAKLAAAALPLKPPGNGDCWDCHLQTQEGKSLGDATKSDHLKLHLDEGYIVPSLVFRALREAGNGDLILAAAFGQENAAGFLPLARERVRRSVARYMYRRFGMAS